MRSKLGVAAIGVSLAVGLTFLGSAGQAEAKSKGAAKAVSVKNACVYATLLCPAVVMDSSGKRYDISGLKRPNANPVNVRGVAGPENIFCGTKVSRGAVTRAKGGVCAFPLRLF